jgi:hypothetical protein
MRIRRTLVAAAVALVVAGCSGGTDPEPASPTTEPAGSGLPTQVLDDARDVAGDLEQRQTDMESMLP